MVTHTLCSSNKLFSSPPFPNSPKQKNGCCKGLDPKVVDPCEILITHLLVSSLTDHSHSLQQQQQALLFSSLLPNSLTPQNKKWVFQKLGS